MFFHMEIYADFDNETPLAMIGGSIEDFEQLNGLVTQGYIVAVNEMKNR